MKILIAPDSFKESLDAAAAADCIAAGMRRALPDATYELVPVADGGEGTVEAVVAARAGKFAELEVTDPLGRPVRARYGIVEDGRVAVLEVAAAAGLQLVAPGDRDPVAGTSYGVGELIRAALRGPCEKIIVGLGGSATNDGGAGMAQALGVRFFDESGSMIDAPLTGGTLSRVTRIDTGALDARTRTVRFEAACDVDNPLCGEQGAAAVFGPQKGASARQVELLDRNLAHFYQLVEKSERITVSETPGAGAAGGLGAAMLAFLGARMRPGVDIVIEAVRLADRMRGATVVVTGEGQIDGQSLRGKAPLGVARLAAAAGIPVIALGGSLSEDAAGLFAGPVDALESTVVRPMSREEALADAGARLTDAGERVARWLLLARRLASRT